MKWKDFLKLLVLMILSFIVAYFIPQMIIVKEGVKYNTPANGSLVSGLITASGFFLAFLSAVMVGKFRLIEEGIVYYIYSAYAIFMIAIVIIFTDSLSNAPTVGDLGLLITSILYDFPLSVYLLETLRKEIAYEHTRRI